MSIIAWIVLGLIAGFIGWERTPWHATQQAAWEALSRVND